MKNIRIGNDISIEWKILRNGKPERLDNKKIDVKLLDFQSQEQTIRYSVEGNIIHIDFFGKNQKRWGEYTLLLIENDQEQEMATMDKTQAFKLVPHSEYENQENPSCPQLDVQSISLESNFVIEHRVEVVDNLNSTSARDALSANQGRLLGIDVHDIKYKNRDQDYAIEDIRRELTTFVKKVDGYGLSKNDFSNAYKNKLDKLENYDDSQIMYLYKSLKVAMDKLVGGSASEAIDNFNEIEKFLEGFTDKESLSGILKEMKDSITNDVSEKYQPKLISGKNISTINGNDITKGGDIVIEGSGGTSDYNSITNKPSINKIELEGNKTLDELGIQPKGDYATKTEVQNVEGKIPSIVGLATKEALNTEVSRNDEQDASISNLENNKSDKTNVVNHGVADTTFTLPPNEYHIWGEVASLNITQGSTTEPFNIYAFEFKSGATPTKLVVNNAKFTTDVDIEPNKTYQVTILNGIAAIGGA